MAPLSSQLEELLLTEITSEIRAAIKASQGNLSLRAAAAKFGVSSRTVGRIYHGGEHSPVRATNPDDFNTLKEQVATLTKQMLALSEEVKELKGQQRYRQPLNPDLHPKPYRIARNDFSSPYRNQPGLEVVDIYCVQIPNPDRYRYQKIAGAETFISQHPVSPGCEKYPYPQKNVLENSKAKCEAEPVAFKDPPPGKACGCSACNDWRMQLAYEDCIKRAYPHSVTTTELFRNYLIKRECT